MMLLLAKVLNAHLEVFVNLIVYCGPLCLALGGSPWQNINRHKPGGLEQVDAHIQDWYKIWTSFKAVARECIKHNGHIAVEWPPGCDHWRYYIVREFLDELQLEKTKFDWCALGLRSGYNDPIRKPWGVATNNGHIFRAFAKYSCPGHDKHPLS